MIGGFNHKDAEFNKTHRKPKFKMKILYLK